jgi:hypothetical protein
VASKGYVSDPSSFITNIMMPKEFLNSYVEKFNAGNLSSLLDMYETEACFVVQPGQIICGLKNIRQSLQEFIAMNGNLESQVKRVSQTSNLALVNYGHSEERDQMESLLTFLVEPQIFCVNSQMAVGA